MPEKEKEGSKTEASSKKSEGAKRVRAPKPKSGEKSASKPKPPAEELSEDDKAIAVSFLEKLKEFFEQNGKVLEEGWRVSIKHRSTGTSKGTQDAYYYSPSGKRYRSRAEICRDFDLKDDRAPRAPRSGGKPIPFRPPVAFTPLSRQDAYKKAQDRNNAAKLPIKTSGGVLVTNLGSVKAEKGYIGDHCIWPPGYTAEFTDDKNIIYQCSITEAPQGPVFRIKAAVTPHEEEEKEKEKEKEEIASHQHQQQQHRLEYLELGSGSTPDAAFKVASDRQAEALELAYAAKIQRGAGSDSDSDDLDEEGLDQQDKLLLRAAALSCEWGTERFGLADLTVLQALEGLPGVDEIEGYTFVDEKDGWLAESQRLLGLIHKHGGKGKWVERKRDRVKDAARRRVRSEDDKNAVAVQRLLQHLVKQTENDYNKHVAAEQKAMAAKEKQLQKMVEKEQRKLAKEKEREHARQAAEAQREAQRRQYQEQQRLAMEARRVEADEILPGAELPPPSPLPLATGRLPPHHQPILLECWQLVHRFAPLLGLQSVPTLKQLEDALMDGPAAAATAAVSAPLPPTATAAEQHDASQQNMVVDAATKVQVALIEFLVTDLYGEAAHSYIKKHADVKESDLKPHSRAIHPLYIRPNTWTEVAHRYLTIITETSLAQGREGAHGVAYPLAVLDPWVVLQYLTAGTTGVVGMPKHALPQAGCCHSVVADAKAVAASEAMLTDAVGGGTANSGGINTVEMKRLLMEILRQIALVKSSDYKNNNDPRIRNNRVLWYGGAAVAAVLKHGKPLDLRAIGAKIDAGVYLQLDDPLAAFAEDVRKVCVLFTEAALKTTSDFATVNAEKGVQELAALAASRLDAALTEIKQLGATTYLELRGALANNNSGKGNGNNGDAMHDSDGTVVKEEDKTTNPNGTGPSSSPSPPSSSSSFHITFFHPLSHGCIACWGDEDQGHLIACPTCDGEWHTYCLDPPLLDEVPSSFICPQCSPSSQQGKHGSKLEFARSSGGEQAWEFADKLATQDYKEWSGKERVELLGILCTLVAESHQIHEVLAEEGRVLKNKRKEVGDLRQEQKRRQSEMAAAAAGAFQQQLQQQLGAGVLGWQGASSAGPAAGLLSASVAAADKHLPPSVSPVGNNTASAAAAQVTSPPPQQQQQQPQPQDVGVGTTTRASVRDGIDMEGLVTSISQLEHELTHLPPSRLEPAGLDRHWNKYWYVSSSADESSGNDNTGDNGIDSSNSLTRPPFLVVERKIDSPTGTEEWQVGCYKTLEQLDALLSWFNNKGKRERPLAAAIKKLRTAMVDYESLIKARTEGALNLGTSAASGAGGGCAGGARQVTSKYTPTTAAAAAAATTTTTVGEVYTIDALKLSMLEFEEGWTAGTHDAHKGSETRREQWRTLVSRATTPSELMAAVVLLENMAGIEWFKPHWRPWSVPAPNPVEVTMLAPVWLRMEALKSAMKLRMTIKISAKLPTLGGSGGSGSGAAAAAARAQQKAEQKVKKRGWWEAQGDGSEEEEEEDDDDDDDDGNDMELDDEAVARMLDTELNADGKITRGRLLQAALPAKKSKYAEDDENDEEEEGWDQEEEEEEEAVGDGDDQDEDFTMGGDSDDKGEDD